MAEETPTTERQPAEADESAAAAPKSSILAKIKVLLFVVIVIAVECLVAYLYLPSASETAAMAGAALGANAEADASSGQDGQSEGELELVDQVEVDLGEFSVTAFQPISNTTLRIDFHLYGTVAAKDENEFLTLMEDNLHRFREQAIVTVRSADITDLTDAGLGLVKRKILDKTNRILGKTLLRVVIFSDFSFIEQ